MGYVNDTAMSRFIPPNQIGYSAGTWTLTVASNVWSNNRTAADESFTAHIPIPIPSNSVALKGCKLVSIEFMYLIGTAAADDFADFKLYKDTFAVTGTLNSSAEVTAVTIDTGHDTAAERLAVNEHRAVITLDTPVFIDNDAHYHVEAVVDCALTTVFKVFGAIVNYTLRV